MSAMGKIRVLVVDDSLFMRAAIKKMLTKEPDIDVIDVAKDGHEAVDKTLALAPDVITMDFNMPGLDGAGAVREIMARRPTPVIMFSAHTVEGARATFEALSAGAVDFCAKPAGEVSATLDGIAEELVAKVRAAVGARPRAARHARESRPPPMTHMTTLPAAGPRIVIIAVSTGGPAALSELIPALPRQLRCPIVIVQHMPAAFTAALAERLDRQSNMSVCEASEGDIPLAGVALIAPGGKHLVFTDRGAVSLTLDAPVNGCRPAADVTMESAARVFGRRAVGVVMTGMGRDGAAGLAAIKRAEGRTYAQDRDTSVIFGMPKAAIDAGVVDEIVPLGQIADRLQVL